MRTITLTLDAEDTARLERVRTQLATLLPDATAEQALLAALRDVAEALEPLEDEPSDGAERSAAEIWINSDQFDFSSEPGRARRLSPDEVRARVLEQRPEWIANDIGRPFQASNISDALHTDPDLAAALEPRDLPGGRFGIVLDEALRARIREALRA